MNNPRIVLLPGRDASGAAAWPRQHGLALNYDALFLTRDEHRRVTVGGILAAMGGRRSALIAHGEAASAAVRAAVVHQDLISSLILCEPELPQLTTGKPVIGDSAIIPGLPTLVLTGGWEPVYERAARVLAESGAAHHVVPGSHRPQDSAEGAARIKDFLRVHAS